MFIHFHIPTIHQPQSLKKRGSYLCSTLLMAQLASMSTIIIKYLTQKEKEKINSHMWTIFPKWDTLPFHWSSCLLETIPVQTDPQSRGHSSESSGWIRWRPCLMRKQHVKHLRVKTTHCLCVSLDWNNLKMSQTVTLKLNYTSNWAFCPWLNSIYQCSGTYLPCPGSHRCASVCQRLSVKQK